MVHSVLRSTWKESGMEEDKDPRTIISLAHHKQYRTAGQSAHRTYLQFGTLLGEIQNCTDKKFFLLLGLACSLFFSLRYRAPLIKFIITQKFLAS